MAKLIAKNSISSIIRDYLPNFIKEDHELFTKFIEAYYEWLELPDNTWAITTNLDNYADVDNTIGEFFGHFKATFLENVPDWLQVDDKITIKNIRELYTSKGSEKSFILLMRMMFGENSEIYYPKDNIFKTNDGKWDNKFSLRLTSNDDNMLDSAYTLLTGATSGATAIIESVIRYNSPTVGLITEVFLSSITGTFIIGENVSSVNPKTNVTATESIKTVFGGVNIVSPGTNYIEGSLFFPTGGTTSSALGKITRTSSGPIEIIHIHSAGTGYSTGDKLVFDNTGTLTPTGYTAVAEVATVGGSGEITSISILSTGYNYKLRPTITVDSSGTGAVLEAHGDLIGSIIKVDVVNASEDYDIDIPKLADLEVWLKNEDVYITKDTNDLVSNWSDISGNTNHAVQATPSYKPTYTINSLNGKPSLVFTDGQLVVPNITSSEITAFVVFDTDIIAPADGAELDLLLSYGDPNTYSPSSLGVVLPSDTNATVRYENLNTPVMELNDITISNSTNIDDTNSYVLSVSGENIDGSVTGDIGIGGHYSNTGIGNSNAKISEVIIYSRILSSAERANVTTYLMDSYKRTRELELNQLGDQNATATPVDGALIQYIGSYLNLDGQPSQISVLQDSEFWQTFSYVHRIDVSSTSTSAGVSIIEEYKQTILDLLHPAGTKLFTELRILSEMLENTGAIIDSVAFGTVNSNIVDLHKDTTARIPNFLSDLIAEDDVISDLYNYELQEYTWAVDPTRTVSPGTGLPWKDEFTLENTIEYLNSYQYLGQFESDVIETWENYAISNFQGGEDAIIENIVEVYPYDVLDIYSSIGSNTRASTATYFNSSGVLSTAPINTQRVDYDPITLVSRGNLNEEARTNVITRSEELNLWTLGNLTATSSTDPKFFGNVFTLDEGILAGEHYCMSSIFTVPADNDHARFSLYAKAGTASKFRITTKNGWLSNNDVYANIDLVAETVTFTAWSTATDASIVSIGDGWYKIDFDILYTSAGTGFRYFNIQMVDDSFALAALTYTGTNRTILVAKPQNEITTNIGFATSYIPTTGSTATRSSDANSTPTATFMNGFNYTFDIEIDLFGVGQTGGVFEARGPGDDRISMYIQSDGTLITEVVYQSVVQSAETYLLPVRNDKVKIALSVAENNLEIFVDGVSVDTDITLLVPSFDTIYLGRMNWGWQMNGHMSKFKVHPYTITAADAAKMHA